MTIAITGHRPPAFNNDYELKSPLILAIKAEIIIILEDYKPITLITGMAQGIDQLFAYIAIERQIPFTAAIPCRGQEALWPVKAQKAYKNILNHSLCTQYLVTDSLYTYYCMQSRNEWMVNNCNAMIAVWNGKKGGTANCVEYANTTNTPVIRINPIDIWSKIEKPV